MLNVQLCANITVSIKFVQIKITTSKPKGQWLHCVFYPVGFSKLCSSVILCICSRLLPRQESSICQNQKHHLLSKRTGTHAIKNTLEFAGTSDLLFQISSSLFPSPSLFAGSESLPLEPISEPLKKEQDNRCPNVSLESSQGKHEYICRTSTYNGLLSLSFSLLLYHFLCLNCDE